VRTTCAVDVSCRCRPVPGHGLAIHSPCFAGLKGRKNYDLVTGICDLEEGTNLYKMIISGGFWRR
jgi:hypothetical protein